VNDGLPFQRERAEGRVATPLSLAELRRFDTIIDARSPSEYAEDHLPDAVNAPSLDDAERAEVGTLYKERGAFEAKRVGAPRVARNIARAGARAGPCFIASLLMFPVSFCVETRA
jgi:tRNA 2-selenouridine synthase